MKSEEIFLMSLVNDSISEFFYFISSFLLFISVFKIK